MARDDAAVPPPTVVKSATPHVTQDLASKSDGTPRFEPATIHGEIGRLGKYRIQRELGRGGMGAVYLAFDERLQRKVALKVMLPRAAADATAKERFLREARAAAQINSDHVVGIHEAEEIDGIPYIALQFLQGLPLDEYLKKKGNPTIPQTIRIGSETALGLAKAHKLGLVHRDIKPGNLWLEAPNGRVKILDFGLAKPVLGSEAVELTGTGAIVGTPAYMPPEQGLGRAVDSRADLFSLGCVLYRLCTGKLPFDRPTVMAVLAAIATEEPIPVRELNPDVPEELADLIRRLMSKNPADRPASAAEVAKELDQISFATKNPKPDISGSQPQVIDEPIPLSVQDQNPLTGFDDATEREPSAVAAKSRKSSAILIGSLIIGAATLVAAGLMYNTFANKGPKPDPEEPKSISNNKSQTPKPKTNSSGTSAAFTNSIGMEFVKIPKGTGWLGGGGGKPGEKKVEFADDFFLGKYEVTQGEWKKLMGANPSFFSRSGGGRNVVSALEDADLDRFPVEDVTWEECQTFVEKLNRNEKASGWTYRMPKEMEWEYACRGGPVDKLDSAYDFYLVRPSNTLLSEHANFEHGQGLKRTCKAGSYEPNVLGLYDMHGNVWEWCDSTENATDGVSRRVARGGSWRYPFGYCRAAFQDVHAPSSRGTNFGLRLARVPVAQEDPFPPTFKNTTGMEFVKVPKGTAWLHGIGGKLADNKVLMYRDFYIGKYEVTQEEWQKVTGLNPSHFSRTGPGKAKVIDVGDEDLKRFPVEDVSWDDCKHFLEKLNKKEMESGWTYRLPTAEESEYACRGGPIDKQDSGFDYYFTRPTNRLSPDQANFMHGAALKRTCKVGSYEPNALGIHDMHGNVCEWLDGTEKKPQGPHAWHRHGAYNLPADICRAADRNIMPTSKASPMYGLRVVRVTSSK